MRNKFNRKVAVFTIISLLILVVFAPFVNSSTVKNNTLCDDTIKYDIYFGTTSPPPKVMSNQSETTYDPGTLEYNTTYYWQIIAWDDQGESAEGPIWSFTTETIGPSVETLDANPVGKNNVTLHGKILRRTKGHRVRIEEKPEVKKAGGVYYTPQYIVDYIVENTVGKLLKGKTPQLHFGLK